jgi:hypothetical protein
MFSLVSIPVGLDSELVLMGAPAHRGPSAARSAANREAGERGDCFSRIADLAGREWLRVSAASGSWPWSPSLAPEPRASWC